MPHQLFLLGLFCAVANAQVPSTSSPPSPSQTDIITETVYGKTIPVGYTIYPRPYDPDKRTIFFDPGGPIPFASRRQPPIPDRDADGKPVQVIVIDTLGTLANGHALKSQFSSAEIAKGFTADKQAAVIHDVVQKLKPTNYAFWGISNGVQQSLRAIDKIQNDASITTKPTALIADSGMGRRVSKADMDFNQKKGMPGPHGKCETAPGGGLANGPPQGPQGIPSVAGGPPQGPQGGPAKCTDDGDFKKYATACGLDFRGKTLTGESKASLGEAFCQQLTGIAQEMPPANGLALKNMLGCPPADRFDYQAWYCAMSCSSFEPGVGPNAGCPPCAGSPLDVKKLNLGKTFLLGIQSKDDCTNWAPAMDYLMETARTSNKTYLQVSNAGGHGTFIDAGSGFAKCHQPETQTKIMNAVFAQNGTAVQQMVMGTAGCYQPLRSTEPPAGSGPASMSR